MFYRAMLLVIAGIAIQLLTVKPSQAVEYQVIDLQPGQTVDVYFEINLTGNVALKIATQTGLGCAELWWIEWPFGNIKSLGKKCGLVRLSIPGLTNFAVAGKLRATGANAPTKIIAASNERVANSVTLHW